MHRSFFQSAGLSAECRRFLAAQGLSSAFGWGTRFAVAWWIFRLTHSGWMLGLAAFLGQGFSLLLIPVGGVLADRWGRRRLYLSTQVASALEVCGLLWLALSQCEDVRLLLAMCGARGVIFALEQPARDGLGGELAGDAHIRDAVAVQGTYVQVGRLAGPAMAGSLIHFTGEWACFALDAISFAPLLAVLWNLNDPVQSVAPGRASRWWTELSLGWRIVRASSGRLRTVLLLTLLNLLALPLLTLMPMFAREELRGGSMMLSLLLVASGIGAIAASVLLQRLKWHQGLEHLVLPALLGTGLALIVLALAQHPWTAAIAMFASGFTMMLQISATNVLLQQDGHGHSRGRLMAVFGMASWGVAPLGSLLAGEVVLLVGLRSCIFLYGLACFALAQAIILQVHAVAPSLGGAHRWILRWEEERPTGS